MGDDERSTEPLHRAGATTDGRTATTDDDVLDVPVRTADATADGATTPEHLMAAALAACYQQALVIAAGSLGHEVAPAVSATVSLTASAGAQGFSATFDLSVSGLDGDHADDLLAQARSICPFTSALDPALVTVGRA